ncbi:MAG: class A sortase [Lactovum sp.]
MKKIKSGLNIVLFILLILVGLSLIFNKSIRNMMIANKTNSYLVSNYDSDSLKKNLDKEADFNFEQVESVDFSSVVSSQTQQNFPVIGGMAIPDVGINLPIFLGLNSDALLYGAGTMKENQEMGKGNYALASHHVFSIAGASELLFSPLTEAKENMKIYLTDKEKVYQYVIDKIYTVNPEEVTIIEDHEGEKEITLVTCTDAAATARLIVHGKLEKTFSFSKSPSEVISAFEMKYNQFQS